MSRNPNFSLTYTHKGKTPGEVVKLITGINLNSNDVLRNYFQQYLNPDLTQTGLDSTQLQEHNRPQPHDQHPRSITTSRGGKNSLSTRALISVGITAIISSIPEYMKKRSRSF
ncbi:MAG: hypothetical protein IPP96_17315 [Chitinophagaceae bacterium]|nr:hypothetical protein [Chitinophagaceae bacterium]